MAIEPKNTREHIISLYGHMTGLKKDISQIKNNHLKHIHEDGSQSLPNQTLRYVKVSTTILTQNK